MKTKRHLVAMISLSLLTVGARTSQAQSSAGEKGSSNRITAATNSGFGFGARALGMGGAFIAIADDASAASWNPAGIGQLIRPEFTLVGSMNSTKTKSSKETILERFTNSAGTPNGNYDRYVYSDAELETRQQGIDFLSYVQPFPLGGMTLSAQVSYSRLNPVGTGSQAYSLQWTDNYYVSPPTEALYSKQDIQAKVSGSGGIDSYTFGLAAAMGPTLYLGVSGQFWRGELGTASDVRNSAAFYQYDSDAGQTILQEFSDLETTESTKRKISGFSMNFGLLWVPNAWFRFGGVYKSKWSGTDTLEVGYERTRVSTQSRLHATGTGQVDSTLEWPDSYGFGVALRPVSTLTLAFDYSITNWSNAKANPSLTGWNYDSQTNTYVPVFSERAFPSGGPVEQDGEKYQNDQDALRFGAQFDFRTAKALVPIRAGYYRVTALSPFFPDRRYDTNPEAKFKGYTGGVGIVFELGNGQSILFDMAGVFEEAESSYNESDHFLCYTNDQGACTTYFLRDRDVTQTIRNTRFIGSLIYRF